MNTETDYFPEVRFRKETVISLRQCYDTDNFLCLVAKLNFSTNPTFLIQVSAPPGGKSSIGFDDSQEVSKNVAQPKNSAAAAKVEHIVSQTLPKT